MAAESQGFYKVSPMSSSCHICQGPEPSNHALGPHITYFPLCNSGHCDFKGILTRNYPIVLAQRKKPKLL